MAPAMRLPLVLCAGLLAAPAFASSATGFEFAVRGSVQAPFGDRRAADLATGFSPGFGLAAELGARIGNGHFSLLAFFSWGLAWSQPAPGVATSETRFGGMMLVRPFSKTVIQPWLGLGLGAENFAADWAFIFTPQAGVDIRVGIFGIGPYVEIPLGSYFRPGPPTAPGARGEFHGWFNAGLRLSFSPRGA
jgi:hypothetical protein